MQRFVSLLVAVAVASLPLPAAAQQSIADDSAGFIIMRVTTRDTVRIGSEDLSVRRTRTEDGIQLQVILRHSQGGRLVNAIIVADTLGSPRIYQCVARDSGAAIADTLYWARSDANHFSTRAVVAPGKTRRANALVPPGVAFLDDSLYAEALLAVLQGPRNAVVIAPWTGEQRSIPVLSLGASAPVTIAGATLPAVRYSLGSGDDLRDIWLTPQGQLLRIEIHGARPMVVQRERVPR